MKELFPYRRRKDWAPRFVEFIRDSQGIGTDLKLNWTDMNCLMWCCMGIEAMTGENPYENFNPDAHSIKEVVRVITSRGYDSLDQILEAHWEEVPIAMAQQGDLVLVEALWDVDSSIKAVMPHGVALADPPFYWCVAPEGLAKGDLYLNGRRAFAVGRNI